MLFIALGKNVSKTENENKRDMSYEIEQGDEIKECFFVKG